MGLVCQDQGFGLLLSPLWGTVGRGAQSPGQSHLVLSQASGAQHLRGSGQRGLGPGAWSLAFKASEGEGAVVGGGGPGPGVQLREGRQGQETAMPAAVVGNRKKG